MTKLANKLVLFTLLIVTALAGCKKMSLLKSEDQGDPPGGSNLKGITIWEYLSQDNFHSTDSSGVGVYGRAVEHAGLKDMLNSPGTYTVIIPTKAAMNSMIASMGFSDLTQVPPIVLKNILSSTIITTAVRSFDLGISETKSFVTINSDSLYFTRKADKSDEYILVINASSQLANTGPTVRSQNLEFKNGVAHVVPTFTYYLPKTTPKDPLDPNNVHIDVDTVQVTKDAYMNAGTSGNTNYGSQSFLEAKTASINFTKRAVIQVPVRAPSFSGRIGSVEMSVYFSAVDATGGPLDFYEDANVDFVESTITWNNAPAAGNVSLNSIPLTSAGLNKRYNGVVTPAYVNAIQSGKTFINIGLNSAGPNRLRVQSKEATASQRPYLLIKSAAVTLLSSPTNTGITVNRNAGIKTITGAELKMEGTAAKNIFYSIKQMPANGFVVVGSMPVGVGSMFSQEQINQGIVKYLLSGTGTSDSFQLEASDFQNGFYPDLLTVNVTIQ